MSTLERVATPLLFAEQMHAVRGKTRLQKLVCLLDARLAKQGVKLGFRFQFYHYGPFSFDLMHEVEDLVDQGLLRERLRPHAGGYQEFTYSLTPAGREVLRRLVSTDRGLVHLRTNIADLARSHGTLPLRELVEQAYAARSELGYRPVEPRAD